MLERIKKLLGLTDTSKDAIIQLNIDILTDLVLELCNRKELTKGLESFIVNKIYQNSSVFMKTESGEGTPPTDRVVKSIARGDTTITYDTTKEEDVEKGSLALTDSDKDLLKAFVRVGVY